MLNHSSSSKVFYEFDSGAVKIKTGDREIKKGSEVTLNYGPLTNAKLLLFYGFSLENNDYDDAELYVPLNPDLPLYKEKLGLLKKLDAMYDSTNSFRIKKGEDIPNTLLALLRLMPLTSLENVNAEEVITSENEFGVLNALESALQSMSQIISGNLLVVGDDRKKEEDTGMIAEYEKVRIYVESELEILSTALGVVRSGIAKLHSAESGLEECD
ncbi:hypothetical protein TL16_g07065 [Triparma laevis f. inornata]|nr:hypothetical protein TL16_g07065 [Triparma laevis f. inornata]